MAVTLLRVLVLGVFAAAADDVPVTWCPTQRASLACLPPSAERISARRPPPPLDADDKLKSKDKPYTWKKDNEEIKKVSGNGTLEVPRKKDGSTEGVYQCSVLHHGGYVLGYPVHLKFAYIDKFSVHPENATVWPGQPFAFSCDISSGPPATITWLRNNEPLPKSTRYYMLKNQLLILDVKQEDAGWYKCRATNPYINRSRTSHAGWLQVENHAKEPSVRIIPLNDDTSIAALKDSEVVLPCPVTGNPRPKITWQLSPPGDRTRELEESVEVLVLPRLQLDQEGVYTCSVDGHSDVAKTFNVTVTEPVVIKVPPASKESFRASTVRFNCTATGRPQPNVVWYKNGKPLPLAGRIVVLPSVDGKRMELLIRSVTSEDAGVYQCFASNGVSSASAWGMLNVTGAEAAAPQGLRCRPTGPHTVALRWENVTATLVAYTVQVTNPKGSSLPSQPVLITEAVVNVDEPLTPHKFQVRAFIRSVTNKTIASDMSEGVMCLGQGVPIKLTKLSDNSIQISWGQFAMRNPDVVEWMLQYKPENSTEVHNVTLPGPTNKYILRAVTSDAVQVRVLGSKTIPWLSEDLSLVPWTSSAIASQDLDGGEETAVPENVEVTDVASNQFTVRWRCEEADDSPELYTYMVCTRKVDGIDKCIESPNKSITVKNLEPDNEYEVRVQVRLPNRGLRGEFSKPIHISTPPEGPQHFRDLSYKVVNITAIRVTWSSVPCKYMVHYTNELNQPIQEWASVEADGNTVLLADLDLTKEVYVMVTGNEPLAQSSIMTIPIQNPEPKDLYYEFTRSGLKVSWRGAGPRIVRFSQNLTQSLEKWPTINVTGTTVTITGLDPSQVTYVMVMSPGLSQRNQVITIQAKPVENYYYYMSLAIACGVVLLCLMVLAAVCIWRRRKKSRSPLRSRRRNLSPSESIEEQGSEMKSIGGRLANGGGSKDAGEPLLNGHVHITENPTSKTPNGRMRKPRQPSYEATFDVARYEEPDRTLHSVLEADTSTSTTYSLLDTSRRPEYDLSTSTMEVSDPFSKLPDDNMNSELNRSNDFTVDNSRIQPTLQPNG